MSHAGKLVRLKYSNLFGVVIASSGKQCSVYWLRESQIGKRVLIGNLDFCEWKIIET